MPALVTKASIFTRVTSIPMEDAAILLSRAAIMALPLPESYWKQGRNGGKLPAGLMPALEENERCRVCAAEELLGVAHRDGDILRFDVGLTGG